MRECMVNELHGGQDAILSIVNTLRAAELHCLHILFLSVV